MQDFLGVSLRIFYERVAVGSSFGSLVWVNGANLCRGGFFWLCYEVQFTKLDLLERLSVNPNSTIERRISRI